MKLFICFIPFTLFTLVCAAQQVYQIKADSVRIYNTCDTAELILENRTQNTPGFLFNKGKGRTEFRKIQMSIVGSDAIAITGQDTLSLTPILDRVQSPANNIYTTDGILSATRKLTGNQRSYGLTFDSLANFFVKGNLLSLVGSNPLYPNNGSTALILQGGQSNWRAFSSAGVVTGEIEIGPGYVAARAGGNGLKISASGVSVGGTIIRSVVQTPAVSYAITPDDYFVAAVSQYNNVAVTLPNAVVGRTLIIKKVSAPNAVTVVAAGTNTIDGSPSVTLTDNGAVLRLIGHWSGWFAF